MVVLTDEERRTLIAEGYPIPQRFPLSKAEERSLKKIRRKIKNKISAQESRRKKKEYMEELEKKVQLMELKIVELERENSRLRGRAGGSDELTMANGADNGPLVAGAGQVGLAESRPPIEPLHHHHEDDDEEDDDHDHDHHDGDADDAHGGHRRDDQQQSLPEQPAAITSTNATSSEQPSRKNSTQSNLSLSTDDDHFIDDILMSQERQEGREGAEVDLVANLVGVVCESGDQIQIQIDQSPPADQLVAAGSIKSEPFSEVA